MADDFGYAFNINTRRDRTDWSYQHSLSRRVKIHYCEACLSVDDLEAHHIDNNENNNSIDNIQTLCRFCHRFWHDLHRRMNKKCSYPMPLIIKTENKRND